MHRKRLLKLANFLRTYVKDDWFDLKSWAELGWTHHECGTTACAVGWATVLFHDEGFRLTTINDSHLPTYMGENDWDAVEKFFGVDFDDACYLFAKSSYEDDFITPDRLNVAARIEDFVKAKNSENSS